MGTAARCCSCLTPLPCCGMNALTYKTERGRQNWPCAFLFPSFEKGVPRSLAANQNAPWVKWRSRILSDPTLVRLFSRDAHTGPLSHQPDITSERLPISEHPPQGQIRKKLEPHTSR